MKILCAWVPNYIYGSCYEETQYLKALKEGNDVKIFPLLMPDNQTIQPLDSNLIAITEMLEPDVFIVWPYRSTIRKETFEYLKNSHIVTVGMFGDDEKYFKDHSETPAVDFTKLFNYSVTNYRPAIEWHKEAGANHALYMPYSANHKVFKRYNVKKDVPVSFCGGKRNSRIEKLNMLMLAGIKIKVYGVGWGTRELSNTQYVNLINRTKVNVNLSIDAVGGKKIAQVKGRDFEVPMSGGFLLTHGGEIEEFYKPGKEIEVYNNDEELIDKIKFYLMKNEKRERIAAAGYERAMKCHRSVSRVRSLLKQVREGM